MGNEVKGTLHTGKERHTGRILLETSELIFRGADYRQKVTFSKMIEVQANDGQLRVKTRDSVFIFEIGAAAEKWREKILHPKTRVEKLGLKAGVRVRLLGQFETDFLKELRTSKADIVQANGSADADHSFFAADTKGSLSAIAKFANKMKGAETLWIVYPKDKKEITENDVISAGRKARLKDVKVVGFSATHTALKFVLPLEKR